MTKSSKIFKTLSKTFFGLGLLAAILAPAAFAEKPERSRLPAREFSIARHPVRIDGATYARAQGVFSFAPIVEYTRTSKGRDIVAVGAEIRAGFADQEFRVEESLWGLRKKVIAQNIGKTVIRLTAVEIREGTRTTALIEIPYDQQLLLEKTEATIAVSAGVKSWSDIEILYHLEVKLTDDNSQPIEITGDDGRRSIRWMPGAYRFELVDAITPASPPAPGFLEPLGSGIVALPEFPDGGDKFTATAILMNTGELRTDTTSGIWHYDRRATPVTIGSVAPGRTAKVVFDGDARAGETMIVLQIGDRRFHGAVYPRPTARLSIGATNVMANHAEDPIDILCAISNTGSSSSKTARLVISAPRAETVVHLPEIGPRDKFAAGISWSGDFPRAFELLIALIEDGETIDTVLIPIERKRRPTPKYLIEDLFFDGERRIGKPGRLTAAIRNDGSLAGAPEIRLAVLSGDGTRLAEAISVRRIGPGEKVDLTTGEFPFAAGLVRGEIATLGAADFTLVDIAPRPVSLSDSEIAFYPVDRRDVPVRLTGSHSFKFRSPGEIGELDGDAFLHLLLEPWSSSTSGTTNSALTLTIKGRGYSDQFRIAPAETHVRFRIPSSALSDTINAELSPIRNGEMVVLADPFIVGVPAAAESGRMEKFAVTDSGILVTIRNTSYLTRKTGVTVAWGYPEEEPKRARYNIEPGSTLDVFLPIASTDPGWRELRVSLPVTKDRSSKTLSRFTPPDPLPQLNLDYAVPAMRTPSSASRAGAAGAVVRGTLVSIRASVNSAHDLDVDYLAKGIDRTNRIRAIPQDRKALLFLPNATNVSYAYVDQHASQKVPPPPDLSPTGEFDIIDFGGDRLSRGRPAIVRIRRCALETSLPEAEIELAINGIAEERMGLPPLLAAECWFGAAEFTPPGGDSFHLLAVERRDLFEPPASWRAVFAAIDETVAVTSPASREPSRVDWEWTRPTIVSRKDTSALEGPFERLARAAEFAAWRILRHTNFPQVVPISPVTVRRLGDLAAETSALARMEYREYLIQLTTEWKSAYLILSGEPLPVMLDQLDISVFHDELENLAVLAGRPTSLDRYETEARLKNFADSLEIILGMRVRSEYL